MSQKIVSSRDETEAQELQRIEDQQEGRATKPWTTTQRVAVFGLGIALLAVGVGFGAAAYLGYATATAATTALYTTGSVIAGGAGTAAIGAGVGAEIERARNTPPASPPPPAENDSDRSFDQTYREGAVMLGNDS